MRRWLWVGFAGLLVSAVVASGYVLFTPKIGHATAAEIDAVLPASLKVHNPPDPEGEARYRRLAEILKGIEKEPLSYEARPKTGKSTPQNEAVLAKVEAILAQGGLRVPKRAPNDLYRESPPLRDGAKLMALAIEAAQKRGDRTSCGRWARLGLRYADALGDSKGMVIDALVHRATDAIVLRAIYLAEINGGFDGKAKSFLLSRMAPSDGSSPRMAEAMRRDFQSLWMPIVLHPDDHHADLALDGSYEPGSEEARNAPKLAGTFNPIETAKLAGMVHDSVISDLRRPLRQAAHAEKPILDKLDRELPSISYGSPPEEYWYRMRMNIGRNTLGRQFLVHGVMTDLGKSSARYAVVRNLVRAVLLLRTGQRPAVPDLFGTGPLHFDTKRKIVWSVGEKGTDDGGAIGRGWDTGAADYGCPYGDRSWAPRPRVLAPPSSGPPGMVGGRPD